MTPSASSSAILVLEKPHSLPRINSLSAPTGLRAHLWRGGGGGRREGGPRLWGPPQRGGAGHPHPPPRGEGALVRNPLEVPTGWVLLPSLFLVCPARSL